MKRSMIGLAGLVFLSLAAAFPAKAESDAPTLNAPKEWVHGFINGYFTIIAYTEGGNSIEVQMKDQGADDSAYRTVYSGLGVNTQYTYTGSSANGIDYSGTFPNMPGPLNVHKLATNIFTTVTCRMRAVNGGNCSAWVDLGDSTGYARATGTWMWGNYNPGDKKDALVDGNLQSMIDADAAVYVGMDFGRRIKLRGIRYYSRADASYNRIYNSRFEYATDASFSDAVTAFNITSTENSDRRHIVELWFDEPVEARYVRHVSATGGRCSLCELEFVPAENPYMPSLLADGYSNDANLYPTVSWTTPAEAMPVQSRVLRATSEAGEYVPVSDWLAGGAGSFSDAATQVGIPYFYKVEVQCNHPVFQVDGGVATIVSDACIHRRLRRLDRSPDDETTLLPGVSYMKCTNNTYNVKIERAFDGKTDTWPDDIAFFYGPVGLKFEQKTWVARFGYVCRTNQSSRMKMVALFSTDAEDVALDNKVQHSARPTADQVSTQPTMFYLDATSLPKDGADQYFLWKCDGDTKNTFHGNVAELCFFGWDATDIAQSGVLMPPTEMTIVRSAAGLAVSWNAGNAATGYRLERRSRGASAWTDVAETDADTYSYLDTGLADGAYEYRVVAKGANDQTAASVAFASTFYAAGEGTGLRSVVYAPFKAQDATLCSPDTCHDRGVEAPNLEFAAADEFAPGSGVTSNAYSAMTGSLLVPFTGSYTFRLDNANGGAVFIDGAWVLNDWDGGDMSGEVQLTAGSHAIEIHARLESAANRVKLYWSGAVSEELVPASQLMPAESPFSFDYAKDWKAHFYGGTNLGAVWTNAAGGVTLRAGPQDASNWRTNPKTVFYAHACKHAFTLSGKVKDLKTGSGDFGLLVRAANGNFVRFYCHNTGTSHAYYNLMVLTEGATFATLVRECTENKDPEHRTDNMVCDMQLVYDDQTGAFIASYHNPSSTTEWTEFARWTNDGSISGEFEVGCFVGGGYSGHDCGEVEFSNIRFRPVKGTLLLFR